MTRSASGGQRAAVRRSTGYFLFDCNEKYFVGRDPLQTKFLIFILVCLRFAFRDFMPEYLTRMSGNARVPVNADQKRRLRTIIY